MSNTDLILDPFSEPSNFSRSATIVLTLAIIIPGLISVLFALIMLRMCHKANDGSMIVKFTWHQAFTDVFYSISAAGLIFFSTSEVCNLISSIQFYSRSLSITWATNLSVHGYSKITSWPNFYERNSGYIVNLFYVIWMIVSVIFYFWTQNPCDIYQYHAESNAWARFFFKYCSIIIGVLVMVLCNTIMICYMSQFKISKSYKMLIMSPLAISLIWMTAFVDDALAIMNHDLNYFTLFLHMFMTRSVGFVNYLIYRRRIQDRINAKFHDRKPADEEIISNVGSMDTAKQGSLLRDQTYSRTF